MKHPDEGRLLAYLDGELSDVDRRRIESWLRETPAGTTALEAVRLRGRIVSSALARTDVALRDVAAAQHRVRNGIQEQRRGRSARTGSNPALAGTGGRWWRRWGLAQAAMLVLLLAAGAAAAVPGSPVREWLTRQLDGSELATGEVTGSSAGAPADAQPGIRARPVEGRLTVVVGGLGRGDLEVRLVDDERGAVYAPSGSRFRSGEGRIEVDVANGPVRVELPRSAREASVRVDGMVYVEKLGTRVELPGPPGTVTDGVFLFPRR